MSFVCPGLLELLFSCSIIQVRASQISPEISSGAFSSHHEANNHVTARQRRRNYATPRHAEKSINTRAVPQSSVSH